MTVFLVDHVEAALVEVDAEVEGVAAVPELVADVAAPSDVEAELSVVVVGDWDVVGTVGSVTVVVVCSDVLGGAASMGDTGSSPTCSSATATICHARAVVTITARIQPPASLQFIAAIVTRVGIWLGQRIVKVSSRQVDATGGGNNLPLWPESL